MSFLPTVREMSQREHDAWAACTTLKLARTQVSDWRKRIATWREAFPDTVGDNALAKFKRAQLATGPALVRLMPAWAKPKPIPRTRVFVPGLPPKYPAWTYVEKLTPYDMRWNSAAARGESIKASAAPAVIKVLPSPAMVMPSTPDPRDFATQFAAMIQGRIAQRAA